MYGKSEIKLALLDYSRNIENEQDKTKLHSTDTTEATNEDKQRHAINYNDDTYCHFFKMLVTTVAF